MLYGLELSNSMHQKPFRRAERWLTGHLQLAHSYYERMIVNHTRQRVRRKRPRRRDPQYDDLPDLINTETGSVVDDSDTDDDVSSYYSDGSQDHLNHEDDDDEGIGITVSDPSYDDQDTLAKNTHGMIDLSNISDDDNSSPTHSSSSHDESISPVDESISPIDEEPRWFDLQEIVDRSGLPTRLVGNDIFLAFLQSGQLTHEVVRYVRHCIEQCTAMESNGIPARVPIRSIANTAIEGQLQQTLGRLRCQVEADIERDRIDQQDDSSTLHESDIVSVVKSVEQSGDDSSVMSEDHTQRDQQYSIYCDNRTNSHRINIFPGLRMRREMRFPVALLPRSLPDRCSICLATDGLCSTPCAWEKEHQTACGRYCDSQISSGARSHCPMLQHFEICPDDDNDNSLFPAHQTT